MNARDALLALYADATPEQRQRGRDWYPAYRRHCARIARETGAPIRRAVATAAILSPDAQLRTNLDWARTACQSRGAAAVGRYPNAMRARYAPVLTGDCAPSDACTGDKVRNFYRAILGDPDAVVLDRWALRAVGFERKSPTPLQYARIAETFREAAAAVGETPRDFQAIVWIVLRERAERADGRTVRLADIHDLD